MRRATFPVRGGGKSWFSISQIGAHHVLARSNLRHDYPTTLHAVFNIFNTDTKVPSAGMFLKGRHARRGKPPPPWSVPTVG